MKIAFIATGDIALPTFENLIENGLKPVVLITQPDKPVGRSQSKLVPPAIKTLAETAKIEVWQPEKIGEIAEQLAALSVDFAVVMAYGQMIGRAVREAPLKGIVNLHASLLPKYRGASCIQAAIENGDSHTGITAMHVIRELDAGNIIAADQITILPEDTGGSLHDKLAILAPQTLHKALAKLAKDPNCGTPQDPALVSHVPKLLRKDGQLDLSQPTQLLDQKIRAYHPWPGTFTNVNVREKNKRLKIFPPVTAGQINVPCGELQLHEGALHLGCGEGSLILSEVQPDGSKRMSASAFVNQL